VCNPKKIAPVAINIRYFVMLAHVAASTGHPQGSRLQRNPFVTLTVKDLNVKG
jgi:hypothetical protein